MKENTAKMWKHKAHGEPRNEQMVCADQNKSELTVIYRLEQLQSSSVYV